MERRRSAAQRHRRQSDQVRHLVLERVELRPDRGQLIAGKRFADESLFVTSHVRHGKIDALHRGLPMLAPCGC